MKNKKIVSRSLLVLSGVVFLAGALFFACGGGGGGGTVTGPRTTKFVGTQSPGDFWTWTITTDSSGSGSFAAENTTRLFTYAGSVSPLAGDASGIFSMAVTTTTDPDVTPLPAAAFGIEMPNTMLMVATTPTFTFDHSGIVELSGRPPIIAAARGACPTTTTNVLWITMPDISWCPKAGASNPLGACAQADNAYGTASAVVSNGTYTIDITPYSLDGTAQTPSQLAPCTCNQGVISCLSGEKIAFTPSGVFFVDTSGSPVAGVVQPAAKIDIPTFLANGRSFKGLWYMSFDDFTGGCLSDSDCTAYPGGTCHSGHCGIPETAPISVTADGTKLNALMYSDIKTGTLGSSGGDLLISSGTQTVPGLIRSTLVTQCTSSISSTTDVAMAVRKINNKYVSFLISYSTCPTFNTGFNVMTIEQ